MVKDRFPDFIILAGLKDTKNDNVDFEANADSATTLLPQKNRNSYEIDEFLHQMFVCNMNCDILRSLIETMKEKNNEILIRSGVEKDLTAELNACYKDFKDLFAKCHQEKTNLDPVLEKAKASTRATLIDRIQCLHINWYHRTLVALTTEFYNEQMQYEKKCSSKIKNFLKHSGRVVDEDEIDETIKTGKLYELTERYIMGTKDKEMLYEDVQARHKDIVKLENSVAQIQELCLDIFLLVDSQQELVDNIESNVSNAAEHAGKADELVKETIKLRASGRKKMIIICIVVLILIIILFGILKAMFCFYLPVCS
uniref:t-SNARE coiled-coil homology domain-containing protein n=1 Tax=Rhabditophanes sp. KR3021 TaxID=114890 RepID=A0AC35U6M1_9BILA